jgi:hypothetical protein
MHSKLLRVILGLTILGALLVAAPAASASFGIESFSAPMQNEDGSIDTQAGSHPYAVTTSFKLNTVSENGKTEADENVKDVITELPAGLIGNPDAVPTCTETEVYNGGCPVASQVGTVQIEGALNMTVGLYNMPPAKGEAAEFGFSILGVPVHVAISVRNESDYGVRASLTDISYAYPITGTTLTLWGVPAASSHNAQRGSEMFCFEGSCYGGGFEAGVPATPLMTSPTRCGEPLTTTIEMDSWQHPGEFKKATATTATGLAGCEALHFAPVLEVHPETTQAGSPTGVTVDLSVPQNENPVGLATPTLKNAVVTLPQGMSISPSLANGLGACTDEQLGIGTTKLDECPENAKIGEVTIDTPLLSTPLVGSLFVGEPQPGNMYRVFLDAENPEHGISVRLQGTISANQVTGQLTASFEETPQMPFSKMVMRFRGGPRAVLSNPTTCGTATTTSELQPWSAPESADASPSSSFAVSANGSGGACPAVQPLAPLFSAGTVNPQAGAFSAFSMTLTRGAGEQDFGSIKLQNPAGVLGMLKSVPLCPEAAAAAGNCPAASLVGHTSVAAGMGSEPFWLGGQVFLTGPYDGAPFGLSIVVPAIAGPFDLGTVVVRAAINVNPYTAAVTVTSDPLPTILQGVPLQLQTINVTLDRANFMFNPTSCNPMTVNATVSGVQGATARVADRFQAADCAVLPFKPTFTASTRAKASKLGGASLTVKVASGPGQANIGKVKVDLPIQLPSRLTTLQKACPASVFEADPANCPAGSDVGSATVATPILARPLTGPAILVSHGGAAFPDLEIVLQGEGITLILDGQTYIKKGVTSNTFRALPDAPISTFELTLPTGPHSALATNLPTSASYSFCGRALTMPTEITGHNGAVIDQDTKVQISGCPTHKHKRAKSEKHKPGRKHGKAKK